MLRLEILDYKMEYIVNEAKKLHFNLIIFLII